ncbi:MAG: UDP-N-acetylmuramoyl-L-alanine--D-glutamate ligase [Patescibacteria group bacterium]
MTELKGKKVTVMGVGMHGGSLEMIRWLARQGARVVATDIKKSEDLKLTIEKLADLKNVEIITGQHRPEDFTQTDLVIKNPAVPWNNKYIRMAISHNIRVEMDSSLFMQFCKSKKIIGVTGTKGKTTTASLIAEILQKAGFKVSKVGIGQEPVMNKLKEIDQDTYTVFELSSWRLAGLSKIKKSPKTAVVTNIFPDHLNHYSSMEDYIKDKKQIYLHQKENDIAIFNRDNDYCREFAQEAKSKVFTYSLNSVEGERTVSVREGKIFYHFEEKEGSVMDLKEVGLRGAHNLGNVLAAVEVALVLGVDANIIRKAVRDFKGVPHRLEFVGKFGGAAYYNDTTATTPESAIAGINSFLRPINLILGGSSKELDSRKLAKKVASSKYVKRVFLLEGAATEEIQEQIIELGGQNKIEGLYSGLEDLLKDVSKRAAKGEVVLFSPGFASFGMFKNEFDRGRQYKEIVKKITL